MQLAGQRLGGRPLGVVARAAMAASSAGSSQERAREVMQELRAIVPFRAVMLASVDAATGRGRTVLREEYSDRTAEYLEGVEFHDEVVKPFGFDRCGWPFRERDMPIDPLELRVVSDYLRPDGMVEGLLSALRAPDGRYLGFLILSVDDVRHPSDAACAVVGHIAPLLANVVDPLQSAAWMASMLLEDESAVALLPDGTAVMLRGAPREALLDADSDIRRAAGRLLAEPRGRTAAFVVPRGERGWYCCSVLSCGDGAVVIAARDADDLYELTRRELEVLGHLVAGRSNPEIAKILWITPRTVRAHVEHILAKLEVPSRSAAVARAMDEGLLLAV